MSTIVLSPTGTASFPDGGGHWWVYLQYALGLRDLGFRVLWLERCSETSQLNRARQILAGFGFTADETFFYEIAEPPSPDPALRWLNVDGGVAMSAIGQAEALLNFDYNAPADVIGSAERSALIDIDPGLLQVWWSKGEVAPAPHNYWFTTGETVGTDRALFTDCGVDWIRIRPCVHLPSWPVIDGDGSGRFTTVTSWWGTEWLALGDGSVLDNNKRAAFLSYVDLPRHSGAALELAAYFGHAEGATNEDTDVTPELTGGDGDDVETLLANGWLLQRSGRVAGDPEQYRRYVQQSTAEFSCVKPSCLLLANAWISDRTLCYLASGRPAVIENTGPSEILDVDAGLLRFNSVDEAVVALKSVREKYHEHRRAARQLAEEHFSAAANLSRIVDTMLGSGSTTASS